MASRCTSVCLGGNGTPMAVVRVAEGATPAEEFAAEELRRHLHELLGLSPALRGAERSGERTGGATIYVQHGEAARQAGIDPTGLSLGPEAFHLETRDGQVYLLGGGPRGVLYGAYELLEALGCRWFTPELGRVPRCRSLNLPALRHTAQPAFEFRDMFNWDCGDPLWWVRNRMNGWFTAVPEYMGGHLTYGLFVHTFDQLVPPGEHFEAHPEYFSLVGGTRRRDAGQLCLTNPDVLRVLTARLLERMRAQPRARIFSVSQNDCTGFCECPGCRAVAEEEGSQSGPILRFVNAVAAETVKQFPDRLIDTLAYWYSLDAPRLVVPHPNVRVRICSINCCQAHGYGTCDHKESARFLKALKGWARLTPQMYIWHYCTNFAHYPLPVPNLDEIQANLNLYRKSGVYGVFMQGMGEDGGGAESMALRGYVISRLMWNPNQPVWPIVDEFLGGVYGGAARQVRRYLDVFHDRVRTDRALHPSLYEPPTHPLFDAKTLHLADAALAKGEATVGGAERQRVRLLRHGLTYARLHKTCGQFRREGNVYRGEATPEDVRAFDSMVRDWRKAGIQHIREGAPLEFTAQLIRNRLCSHKVEWLKDEHAAVAVVADLGGRLLEWHAHGLQWLAPPDPDNNWNLYPMSEGYVEFAQQGLYSYQGWGEAFRARKSRGSLSLKAKLGNGLELARRLTLRDGRLCIESRLKNTTRAAITAGWGAGLHLLIPQPAATALSWDAAAGTTRLEWGQMSEGLGTATVLEGERVPAGEWCVQSGPWRLRHAFKGEPVVKAIIGKVTGRGTLALDLRTEARALAPGEAIRVVQHIRIETVS